MSVFAYFHILCLFMYFFFFLSFFLILLGAGGGYSYSIKFLVVLQVDVKNIKCLFSTYLFILVLLLGFVRSFCFVLF